MDKKLTFGALVKEEIKNSVDAQQIIKKNCHKEWGFKPLSLRTNTIYNMKKGNDTESLEKFGETLHSLEDKRQIAERIRNK